MPSMLQMLHTERGPALRRVLRGLPDEFLAALVEGIEGADVIVSGRLFAGRDGGCAVGVMLRVARPHLPRRPGWGRSRRSLTKLDRGLAKEVAHLGTLESVFDRSIELAGWRYPDARRGEIAWTVASWVAEEARARLLARETQAAWLDELEELELAQIEHELRELDELELERQLSELEHELPAIERELVELLHERHLPA